MLTCSSDSLKHTHLYILWRGSVRLDSQRQEEAVESRRPKVASQIVNAHTFTQRPKIARSTQLHIFVSERRLASRATLARAFCSHATMSLPTNPTSKGLEILSLRDVRATQQYSGENVQLALGTLQVLLVSIELEHSAVQARSFSGSSRADQDYSSDLWLVLAIGEEFGLPVPATQIIKPERHRGTNAYVFPSAELEGASIRIALPETTDADDVRKFQQILAQYAAYQDDDRTDAGKIELVDEHGKVIGVLEGDFNMHETDSLSDAGNQKTPVLVDLRPEAMGSSEKQNVQVDVLKAEEKPDWMLKGADSISRMIIKSTDYLGSRIQGAANSYVSKSSPAGSGANTPVGEKSQAGKPGREAVQIDPKTQARVQTLHQWSGQAVQVSSKTTGAILQVAGNIGNKIGQKTGIQRQANPDGTPAAPPTGIRGFINRSLIAANTVLDGIDTGAQTLLESSGGATSKVVGHRYGDEARQLADGFGRTGKNVFVVYKDIRGVRRNALLRAANANFKAKLDNGQTVDVHIDEKGNAVALPDNTAPNTASAPATAFSNVNAASTEKSASATTHPLHTSAAPSSSSSSVGYTTPPAYSSATSSAAGSQTLPPPPTHHSVRRSPSPQAKE